MNRGFTFLLVTTFLLGSLVYGRAPTERDLRTLRVGRIGSETFQGTLLAQIKKATGIESGQRLNLNKLDEGIRQLVKSGRVQALFVDVDVVGKRLNITLRGSKLRRIRNIRFSKIDPAIVEEARANLILEEGQVTDMRVLTELREQLKQAYERRGFYSADVKITVLEQPGKNYADVEISVQQNDFATVGKITLVGLSPKEKTQIESVMTLGPGDRFSKAELDASIARVKEYLQENKYYTSRIEQTSQKFNSDKSQVDITIVFKISHRVQYVLRGNKVFYEVELRDLMTEEVLSSLNATVNIVDLIEEKYKTVGYHFSKVKVSESFDSEDKTKTVVLEIIEGPKVRIDKLHFNRNRPEIGTVKTIDEDTLRSIFYEGAPGILSRKVYWQKGLKTATVNFQERVEKLGYLNARFSDPKIVFSDDKRGVELFFDLELGVRTLISAIQFVNNKHISDQELIEQMPFKVGDPFYLDQLKDGREEVVSYYSQRGYVDIKILGERRNDVTISRDQESAIIKYELSEGVQYRVGSVSVEGNRKTKPNVILREILLKPGDIFNPKLVEESEEAISLLGLFARSELIVTDSEEPAKKNIKAVVRELAPGLAELGFGATYEDPLFRLRAFGGTGYSNLFGRNHSGSVRGEVRLPISGTDRVFPFLEYAAILGYVAPYPFEIPVTLKSQLGLDSFQTAFDPTNNQRTVQTRARFEISVEKKLGDHVTVGYRLYRLERTNTEVFDTNQNQVSPDEIDVIGSTGPSLILDFRDDVFNPKIGSYHLIDVEFAHPALLSNDNISFVMVLARNSFYLPLFGPLSLVAYAGGGYAWSLFGNTPLPEARLVNDLSLGGQPSIRGFTINQFQPGNNTTQTAFYNARVEVGAEIFAKFKSVVFLDSGQIFPLPGATQARHDGVGVGFRYETPVGPIAVDLAHGIGPDGKAIQFYFSIGTL